MTTTRMRLWTILAAAGTLLCMQGCAGNSDATYFARGEVELAAGHWDAARGDFTTLVQQYPTSTFAPAAQVYIGQTWFEEQSFAPALAAEQQALAQYPDSDAVGDAHLWAGRAEIQLHEPNAALADLRAALAGMPSPFVLSEASFWAARAEFDLGDDDHARSDFEAVLGRFGDGPHAPACHLYLGEIAYHVGDLGAAEMQLNQAASTATAASVADEAHYFLVRVYADEQNCAMASSHDAAVPASDPLRAKADAYLATRC